MYLKRQIVFVGLIGLALMVTADRLPGPARLRAHGLPRHVPAPPRRALAAGLQQQGRPGLVPARVVPVPAVGVRQGRADRVPGVYCAAHRGDLDGRRLFTVLALAGGAGRADLPTARPRHRPGVRRHPHGHAAGRRRPAPPHGPAGRVGGGRRGRRAPARRAEAVPARPPGGVPRPPGRHPPLGVQPQPVEDRHRVRRRPRQGPVQGHPDQPVLRARAAHRLHLHGRGRGARASSVRCCCSALFAIVVWRTWRTAALAKDLSGTLICVGVLAMLVFQIFENVGHDDGHHADHRHPAARSCPTADRPPSPVRRRRPGAERPHAPLQSGGWTGSTGRPVVGLRIQ